MYKRKVDSETFYDRRESIGSTTTALGSEVSISSGCNGDGTSSPDHYNPTLRLLQIPKSTHGSLGFHLTRSKWDPYPWVSAVDVNTPAKFNGLKAGDCVLEVNGQDVLGLRISDIAKLVKSKSIDSVSLLLWSAGCDTNCNPESLCCGPMPLNLERLSACTQTILTIIECPVCLDTIAPPALQCQNGHILCVKCRILSQTCPVCRQRFYPGRSLIAEQIYNTITDTFNLRNQDKLREKLFGSKYKRTSTKDEQRRERQQQQQQQQQNSLKHSHEVNKFEAQHYPPPPLSTNKFLAKLLGKAYSMDNLSTSLPRPMPAIPLSMKSATNHPNGGGVTEHEHDDDGSGNSNSIDDNFDEQSGFGNLVTPGYRARPATISKQLSISAYDLSKKDNDGQVTIEGCLSTNRLHYLRSKRNSLHSQGCVGLRPITPPPSPQIGVEQRRPCASLSTSIECVAKAIQREDGLQQRAVMRPAVPRIQISCCLEEQREDVFYLCPCSCRNRFSGSALQQHVKADHRTPILCYGGSSAELSLPLKAPLDNASMLLMCDGKDFWIKLRTHGSERSITASALLQGSEDESSDFMMETRLRNRIVVGEERGDDNGVVDVAAVNNDDDDGILERELITRSIVRSMMLTTWEDTSAVGGTTTTTITTDGRGGGGAGGKPTGILYSRENIRMTFGEAIDYRNLLLKIIIKHRVPKETAPGGSDKWLGV